MTQTPLFEDPHQALRHLLDVYGADRTRWPAAERLQLSRFIASDPRARTELAEAAALESVLDRAPRVSAERERVVLARIESIIAADVGASRPTQPTKPERKAPIRSLLLRPVSALLAASLMLGIVSGSSSFMSPTIDALADAMGLGDSDTEIVSATDILHGTEEAL
jgi:anti-sigma factor RsiW